MAIIHQLISFITLFLLLLVTGVFWGPWLSLHRSLKNFDAPALIELVKTLAANLAKPMRIMMPTCLLFLLLSMWMYPEKNSPGFYLIIFAFVLSFLSLLITLLVEIPIVNQIKSWSAAPLPPDWGNIRDRWVRFHVLRTFVSLASFACFSASLLFMF